jgi:small GTP-binding protein
MSNRRKVVLLGDSGVGKTSIVHRASVGTFRTDVSPTVGAAHSDITVSTPDAREVTLAVWDTAGQERFRNLVPMYFHGACAAIIVFDIACRQSFASVSNWIDLFRENTDAAAWVVLLGNKADLDSVRTVTPDEVDNLKTENNIDFYLETSALTNQNITNAFAELATIMDVKFSDHEKLDANDLVFDRTKRLGMCC